MTAAVMDYSQTYTVPEILMPPQERRAEGEYIKMCQSFPSLIPE